MCFDCEHEHVSRREFLATSTATMVAIGQTSEGLSIPTG